MTDAASLEQRFLAMLMESQYWTPAEMQAHQRRELGHLLVHARTKVPFYQDRLDAVFRPDGSIDWDRWGELPIVTRKDLTERGDDLRATEIPEGHGGAVTSRTSGTSGKPVTVYSTQLAGIALRSNRFRAYHWHGIDWGKLSVSVFGEDPDEAAWPHGTVMGPWGPSWDSRTSLGQILRINRLTPYDRIVEFLERKRPAYLATGPKIGLAIALEAERLKAHVQLEAFLPQGANVGQLEHVTLKRAFGARTAELYSSKEAGQIAHGCPDEPGLHVNAESVLVEILDDHGKPCPPWQPGRVVVTPLYNTAQPLIRYAQGDTAQWLEPCPCGRHLPRIAGVIGRSTLLFHHPDGRMRSAFVPPGDRAILKCREWQIAQTGPHRFEVRYVPLDWNEPGDEARMTAKLRQVYFDDAEIGFVRARELPSRGGKTIEYVHEWLPEGAVQ